MCCCLYILCVSLCGESLHCRCVSTLMAQRQSAALGRDRNDVMIEFSITRKEKLQVEEKTCLIILEMLQSRNSLLCHLQEDRIAEEFEITMCYIDF